MTSQIATSKTGRGGTRYLPMVFTEQGVAMLASILTSDKAIAINIQIVRVFTRIRQMLMDNTELRLAIEVLQEEFLIPLEISVYRLSKDVGIPQTRISEIIKGTRRITADTALRLSRYFGNSAKFWLGLQDDFDIEEEIDHKKK